MKLGKSCFFKTEGGRVFVLNNSSGSQLCESIVHVFYSLLHSHRMTGKARNVDGFVVSFNITNIKGENAYAEKCKAKMYICLLFSDAF